MGEKNNISPFDQKDAYWLFLRSIFNESSHFSVSDAVLSISEC